MPTHVADIAPNPRGAGATLGAATLLVAALLAFHPRAQPDTHAAILAQIAALRLQDQIVHGGIIACLALIITGVTCFAQRLGLRRPPVLAGLLLFCGGAFFAALAGVFDGFVLPDIAARFSTRAPAELEAGYNLLILSTLIVQSLGRLGFVGISAGIFVLSVPLRHAPSGLARIGWIGCVAGALPVLGLLTLNPMLAAHLVLGIFLVQASWLLSVARWMET